MKGRIWDASSRSIRSFARTLVEALQEIFDEAAYARFLRRERAESSCEAYGRYLRETESARERRPRCC
jgi:hypothetical protein